MQDLIERLDAELSHAPDPTFDVPGTLASGRRAVRRRRLAVGAAGLAAAVVVGGTAALAFDGGGASAGRDGNVAEAPTTTAPTTTPTDDPWLDDELLRVGGNSRVTVNPDADVIERADVTTADGAVREIFHLGLGGREYYAVAGDAGYSSTPLPAQGLTLREWAEQELTLDRDGGEDDRPWVTLDTASKVTAEPGVEVVAWRPDPGLGDNFAAPGEPTAVAEVVRDGFTYFLAVRRSPDGATEAIPYRKDATIATLDAFVSWARDQYATNDEGGSEGLR